MNLNDWKITLNGQPVVRSDSIDELFKAQEKKVKVTYLVYADAMRVQHQEAYIAPLEASTRISFPMPCRMEGLTVDNDVFDDISQAYKEASRYCNWRDICVLLEDGKWHPFIPIQEVA